VPAAGEAGLKTFFEENHVNDLRLRVAAGVSFSVKKVECGNVYGVKGALVSGVEITDFGKRFAI
jgi:hypothetical protein